ncbi:unnamed protein product [Soboliphyme baturini]|uniref:Integrin alpha-2 domain-containing protein n=1 Tax=Soboliphyme baturini TaxID=241478 RepID=A0A183JAH6_9BILA|nr:unnamed protein product [Soboliphyme baturini]
MCLPNDQRCLDSPISISNNFIALPSNLKFREYGLNALPLFTMKGPQTTTTSVQFELVMRNVSSPDRALPLASRQSFLLQKGQETNSAIVALVESLQGPQDVQVDLVMHVRHAFLIFGGKAIARLTLHVSENEQTLIEH